MFACWELGTLYGKVFRHYAIMLKWLRNQLSHVTPALFELSKLIPTNGNWALRLILEQLLVHELHAEALTKKLREMASVHRLCRSHLHKMSQCAQHNQNELANQMAKSNQHQDLCMWRPKYENTLLILASQNSKEAKAKAVLVKD